jgi:hypothetical protein
VSTSGTYNFSVNSSIIVQEAMLNIGAIGENEVPTASEYSDCLRKLNMLAKQWMGKQDFAPGLKMWTRRRGTVFLGYSKYTYTLGPNGDNWCVGTTGLSYPSQYNTAQTAISYVSGTQLIQVVKLGTVNVGDYIGIQYQPGLGNLGTDLFWTTVSAVNQTSNTITLAAPITGAVASSAYVFSYTTKGQRPLNVVTALLRDIYANDTPLNFMTLEDYEQLPNKTTPTNVSDPTAVYYESQIGAQPNLGGGVLYIDCSGAQDVTKVLHVVYLIPVQDFDNPGDNPEYPQQWYRPLCWGLSREICGMFDCVWTPDMAQNYSESMAMAREADSETTSFFFQVDATSPYDP